MNLFANRIRNLSCPLRYVCNLSFQSAAALITLFGTANVASTFAGDWPGFLGPGASAHSSDSVPTRWSESENLAWKVDLPGSGSSSPIVARNKLIVTCYVNQATPMRQVFCFDKLTGKQLWAVDFPIDYREDGYRGFITEHGYASNTPATDGQDVFVFLGKGGVHRISLDGETKWSVDAG